MLRLNLSDVAFVLFVVEVVHFFGMAIAEVVGHALHMANELRRDHVTTLAHV
jgi:hypothetical protein